MRGASRPEGAPNGLPERLAREAAAGWKGPLDDVMARVARRAARAALDEAAKVAREHDAEMQRYAAEWRAAKGDDPSADGAAIYACRSASAAQIAAAIEALK